MHGQAINEKWRKTKMDEPKDRVSRADLATQLRSVIGRWKRVLNTNLGSAIQQPPPTGKLGEIVRCLEAPKAASLHDLTTLTGWKRATVHGALSRLRARGYPIKMRKQDGAPTYRLEAK
jgi:biotin operon repressor